MDRDSPVLSSGEVSRLEKDGRSVVPRHVLPILLSLERRLDGRRHKLGSRVVVVAEGSCLVRVGSELGEEVAGLDLKARRRKKDKNE